MLQDRALRALRRHRVPAWWSDAKLGIFVHWTPASVPAFAPVDSDIAELLRSGRPDALAFSPYAEWYENSLRFPDSPVARHHRRTYGDRPYERFVDDWVAGLEAWDPQTWAADFAATGARYVVFVAKHMDGYCMWPTQVPNPARPGWHCQRDVVGELAEAVRGAGMSFGLYYSGGLDSTFNDRPIGTFADLIAAVPRGDYAEYADAQVRELIRRYSPSVLWNDIAWPGAPKQLWALFRDYYAEVPDGVVNDRWMPWSRLLDVAVTRPAQRAINAAIRRGIERDAGLVPPRPPYFDVRTPEYVAFDSIQTAPWECVRGMDQSFGHNTCSRSEHFMGHGELLWMFVDIIAKGGNLLLNVGPRGVDAQIPDPQLTRLGWLAEWVPTHGDAIFASRPWVTAGTTTGEGDSVRYTARDEVVYAFVREPPETITLPELRATPTTSVTTLDGSSMRWVDSPSGISITPPAGAAARPTVLRLRDVAARPNEDGRDGHRPTRWHGPGPAR